MAIEFDATLELIFDYQNRRFLRAFDSTAEADLPPIYQGDSLKVTVRAVTATGDATAPWRDVSLSGSTVYVGIGDPGETPVADVDSFSALPAAAVNVSKATTGASGVNEVQCILFNPVPYGGTYTLAFGGQRTAPIAIGATDEEITAALEALSTIGEGNVAVTVAWPEVYVTFQEDLGGASQSLLTVGVGSLKTPVGKSGTLTIGQSEADTFLGEGVDSKEIDLEVELTTTGGRVYTHIAQTTLYRTISGNGSPSSEASSYLTQVQSDARYVRLVSVERHGAYPSNTAAANHTAIAAAVAEVNADGGILYFPRNGTYQDSGEHELTGPAIVHESTEEYRGHFIIQGQGTGTVWNYTGSGTFLTVTTPDAPPTNMVFRDITLKGPTGVGAWDGTSIGLDIANTNRGLRMDNVEFIHWGKAGARIYDCTGAVLNHVSFIHSKIGLAADYKFNGAVITGGLYGQCDIGVDLGHNNPAKTYASGVRPPTQESVTIIGAQFGYCRIGVIAGGYLSRGIKLDTLYFEASTETDIDVGHNTVDYSGDQLEGTGRVYATIMNCTSLGSAKFCRLWCPSDLFTTGNIISGGSSLAMIESQNANGDTSYLRLLEPSSTAYRTSGGTIYAGQFSNFAMRFQSTLTVQGGLAANSGITATGDSATGLVSDGATHPGVTIKEGGTTKAIIARASSGGAWLSDSNAGDVVIKTSDAADDLLLGCGSSFGSLRVAQNNIDCRVALQLRSVPLASFSGIDPADHVGGMFYCPDATGGATLVWSNGTDWMRVADNSTLS